MPEEQSFALVGTTGDTVDLSFLEQSITVAFGTSTAATIQGDLEGLLTVSVRMEESKMWQSFVQEGRKD